MDALIVRFSNRFWVQKNTILTWILLQVLACQSYEFDMQDYCGKSISMNSESLYQLELEFDDYNIYKHHNWFFSNTRAGTCETTIVAPNPAYNKLSFYFDDLDLGCNNGHLEFYVGSRGSVRVTGLENDVCGDKKPKGVYTVDSVYLRIKYIPKKVQVISDIFSIIITSYDDSCDSNSYKCDNSRCIDKSIACNEHDSCGDGSGCGKHSAAAIVGATVGSLVAVVIIVGVIAWCCCCRKPARKQPGAFQGTSSGMSVTYNAGNQAITQPGLSYPGFNQPTYGVNYGGSYPTSQPAYPDPFPGAPPAPITAGQPDYYQQTQDLPPPYTEVAETHQGPHQVETPEYQNKKPQEPVYEDPENVQPHDKQ